jgi:hypothetical protein
MDADLSSAWTGDDHLESAAHLGGHLVESALTRHNARLAMLLQSPVDLIKGGVA